MRPCFRLRSVRARDRKHGATELWRHSPCAPWRKPTRTVDASTEKCTINACGELGHARRICSHRTLSRQFLWVCSGVFGQGGQKRCNTQGALACDAIMHTHLRYRMCGPFRPGVAGPLLCTTAHIVRQWAHKTSCVCPHFDHQLAAACTARSLFR